MADRRSSDRAGERPIFRQLLRYLSPYRGPLLAALLLLVMAKVVEALIPIYIGNLTNRILDASPEKLSAIYPALLHSGGLIAALLLAGYLLETGNIFIKSWAGQKALYTLRCDVYDHIIRLPISTYDKNAIGTMMTRTIHDVDQIDQMFTESIVAIIGNALLFVAIFIAVTAIEWRVAVALALITPLVIYHTNSFRLSQRNSYQKIRHAVASMNGFVQEELLGISLIKKFGTTNLEKKKFSTLNDQLKEGYLQSIKNFSLFISGIDFAMTSFLTAVFVLLVLFTPKEGFQGGTFLTLSLYSLMLFRPLSDIAERYNLLQAAFAAAERIFSILDEPCEEIDDGTEELGEIESIHFDAVWFAYKKEEWVLKNLSLSIEAGHSSALVGVTGAGKSSIVALLLRFHDFQKGEISINGKSIRSYTKSSLRKQFSLVLQDPVILTASLRDNITLHDDSIDENAINSAIDYVALRDKVNQWEKGIDHTVAERGKSLSVGEMQLICMARAVVNRRSVVILDEATANVDSQTEKLVQSAIKKIARDRTSIIIAHRLSTIRDVDTIYVVNDGTVVEKGSHKYLLDKMGLYEKLYRLQSQ